MMRWSDRPFYYFYFFISGAEPSGASPRLTDISHFAGERITPQGDQS
jgi:hypothetical protein